MTPLWLLACTGEPDARPKAPVEHTGEPAGRHTAAPEHSGEPAHSAAPLLPLVDEALAERCPDPTPAPERAGDDLHRVTLTGSAAVCNDGTPPVLYVAAAADPASADDWVLSLESGLFCGSNEDCAVRWCGEDQYDASKMSTRWAPLAMGVGGVLDPAARNVFAPWNRVSFKYCSSDLWTGTHHDQPLADGDPPFRLHFEGHEILMAGLDALAAGVTSDDGLVTLPPLSAPHALVFAGSSSSGFGVLQHQDVVAARFSARRFTAVVDGWSSHPAPGVADATVAAQVDVVNESLWRTTYEPLFGMVVDESCGAAEAEPWRCTDTDHLLRTHLSAPRVLRSDLRDGPLYGFWTAFGVALPDYPALVAATLRSQADLPDTAALGPSCGAHVVSTGSPFFDLTVDDASGRAWSLHDAVVAQLFVSDVTAIDDGTGAASVCP